MTLGELYEALSYGELSNLSMSGEGSGTIDDASQPKVLLYANDGLLRLYSKFVLNEKSVLIEQYEHITFYHLLPRFAVNYTPAGYSDTEEIRYIIDTPGELFLDDVIKPLQVYDSINGRLPLNDDNNTYSVFTPQAKCIQVPNPVDERMMSVSYQARHPIILGELDEIVYIPDVLMSALTAYIAYKVYSHMNTQESTTKAQEHIQLYEAICVSAKDNDLLGTSISVTNTRFEQRGWI